MDAAEQALTGMASLSLADSNSGSGSGSSSSNDKSQPPPPPPSSTASATAGAGAAGAAGAAVGLTELGGMSPFEFFVQEVESEDDVYLRLHAYRRIRVIAQALGPEQTERVLLPFLQEKASTLKDDEVLLILAQELGQAAFLPLVHSPAALLSTLTNLAGTEETVVREAAVASLLSVLSSLPAPVPEGLSTFKSLAQGEMFCHKVSAAALFPTLYAKIEGGGTEGGGGGEAGREGGEGREQLRALFESALVNDDSPMVRRAAAAALPETIKALPLNLLCEWLVPLWTKLAGDDQDIVRLAAIEATVAIAQALQNSGIDDRTQQHVLPLVRHAVEDRSWRVRQALARDYAPLSIALKGEGGQRAMESLHHDLLPGLVALLQDNEAEVRIAALTHAYAAYCPLIGAGLFTQHLLPCAHLLAPDSLPGVRLALSTACLDSAPLLGQAAFMQHLMPLLERFLMDPNAPDVKVRLHILSRLAVIGAWLPSSSSSSAGTSSSPPPSILPILLHLRDDDNWRLRKAAIEALPVLAEHMSAADHTLLFEPALLPHLLSAFQDRVCQVRMAATGALHHLARVTGPEFIQSKVLPRMKELFEESGFYLVRSAVLQAMKSLLVEGETSPSLLQEVLSLVLEATEDKIPNVRFTAAQVLAKLSSFVDPSSLESTIQPCLQNLVSSDPDGDVRLYSALALEQKEEATLTVAAPAAVDNSDAGAAASALAAAVAATGGVGVAEMG